MPSKKFSNTPKKKGNVIKKTIPNLITPKHIGTFGDISFYANNLFGKYRMLGISDISLSSEEHYEQHTNDINKPSLEFISHELDDLSFNVYANAQYGVNPLKIKKKLEAYKKKGTPNYFVLGGTKIGNSRWVITKIQSDFSVIYQDGRIVCIKFEVQLKEYPNKTSTSVSSKNTNKKTSSKTVKKTSYTRYVVQKNETLWTIAQKFYKDGSKAKKIFNANQKASKGFNTIPNMKTLKPGWVIKIPR